MKNTKTTILILITNLLWVLPITLVQGENGYDDRVAFEAFMNEFPPLKNGQILSAKDLQNLQPLSPDSLKWHLPSHNLKGSALENIYKNYFLQKYTRRYGGTKLHLSPTDPDPSKLQFWAGPRLWHDVAILYLYYPGDIRSGQPEVFSAIVTFFDFYGAQETATQILAEDITTYQERDYQDIKSEIIIKNKSEIIVNQKTIDGYLDERLDPQPLSIKQKTTKYIVTSHSADSNVKKIEFNALEF